MPNVCDAYGFVNIECRAKLQFKMSYHPQHLLSTSDPLVLDKCSIFRPLVHQEQLTIVDTVST